MVNEAHKPEFANEAEEAEWWQANRDRLAEEDARAFREGRVKRRSPEYMAHFIEAQGLARALDLSSAEFEAARLSADKRGVTLPVYIRDLFHAALRHEGAMAGLDASSPPEVAKPLDLS